jgi:Family of unknown function (DUF6084)
MPDLAFRIEEFSPMRFSATPMLTARLRISNTSATEPIHSILLNCQVRIEPLGRKYNADEEARLRDLFGGRERWARTMKPLLWVQTALNVPGFTGSAEAELPLPCTLDFDLAATKFFYGLKVGEVPVSILFSGTIFYAAADGRLQAAQIPWDREARYPLPASAWKAAVEMHYPNAMWLRLARDSFDQLYEYKIARGLQTWEQVIEQLIERAGNCEPAAQPAEEMRR